MKRHICLISMIALTLLLALPRPGLAQPVGDVDAMFSVDDGATFQDVAMVDDMDTFLMRIYFDNTGDEPGTGAAVTATLPAGFSHVGGTTRVCLEPEDGVTICNDDVDQSGPIDEGSVWSGQDLSISPTAGLFAEATGLTSGLLEIGKARFINFHECHYFDGSDRYWVSADPDVVGSNVANTADSEAVCLGSIGAYGINDEILLTVDLLARRYLNYHECHYNFFSDHIFINADGTATGTSNGTDADFECAGTAGSHGLHPDSSVTNFDLFGQRYLNLWECHYQAGGDTISFNTTYDTGSNTSNTPDATPGCDATNGTYSLIDSDLFVFDTLDTTRGRGFVEVEVLAASGAGDFDIDTGLAANEFATETDSGTVSVMAGGGPTGPVPGIDLVFSHSCLETFEDMAMPYPGEVFTTRIYFDNTGDAAGSDAVITTTVPDGYTLVPGTTRVCTEPEPGVTVCNTDAGQGGPIDEAAVWTGQVLEIAPLAGLDGEAVDAATSILPSGRKKYLNLHECHYYDGFNDRLFLTLDQGVTGTNVSNVADVDPICGATAHGRTLVSGSVSSFELSSGRYWNVHECQYQFFFFSDRIFIDGTFYSGSNVGPTADAGEICAPTAGSHNLVPGESHLATFDLASGRYLNLHECVYLRLTDHLAFLAGPETGTNVSDVEDTLVQCDALAGSHNLVVGEVAALDMLDPTRGRGFVEYQVLAGAVTGSFNQTAALNGSDFATTSDVGEIMAAAGILFKDGFECGDTSKWSSTFP